MGYRMEHTGRDDRPIGVFDSGIGGLTAMKELIRLLPNEDIIYYGDTARVPYGSHSPETIIRYAKQDLSFLLRRDVKAVLVACGTVSANALDALRAMTDIPIIGVIDASASAAVQRTGNKRVAVLATSASVRSRAYSNAVHRMAPDVETVEKACPLFVPLIENGYADSNNPVTRMVVRDYLQAIRPFSADTVILGCTHYPLLKAAIGEQMPNIELIEAGKEAARELVDLLREKQMLADPNRYGTRHYAVSEITASFRDNCTLFLGEDIGESIETVQFD